LSTIDAAAGEPPEVLVPEQEVIGGWIKQIVERGIRRPGYDADRWTEQWTADQFRSFGLADVVCEPVELPMWEPAGGATLEAWPSSDPNSPVQMTGLALPHSRPVTAGIEAEVAMFTPGSDGQDVAGKLAVVEVELIRMPVAALRDRATFTFDPEDAFDRAVQILPFGASFMEVMEPAIAAGAAGFIGALTGVPWETSDYYVPYDGLERPLPGLWISPSSSRRLLSMVERGPVRARMTTSARRHPATTHNVVGWLPGLSDDWVVVASHHDGPWASAVEDASGTALVLAQARYWSEVPVRERPHNMMFLLTSGHMAGAAGAKAFVDRHRMLLPRIVLELHLEHAARHCEVTDGRLVPTDLPEPRWWFTTQHPGLESLVVDAIRTEDLRRSLVLPPDVFFENPPTDGSVFYAEGVPIVQFLTAPMYLFDSQDTLDKIHGDTLVPLTRAVASIIAATTGASADTFRSEPTGG
jgi:hypothetical protein